MQILQKRILNRMVIISKPDLGKVFDGKRHIHNVGIHGFIHLIDKYDGMTEGIPKILIDHFYSLVWLKEIKRELEKIRHRHSDIDPYAILNDAEFL